MSALLRLAYPPARPSKAGLLPSVDADAVFGRLPVLRPSAVRHIRTFAPEKAPPALADAYVASRRPGLFTTLTEALWTITLWLIYGVALLAAVLVVGAVGLDMVATGLATVQDARLVVW